MKGFIQRAERLIRSPAGRALAALAGLTCLALIVRHAGPKLVWEALQRTAHLFPLVVLLEAALTACEIRGLYSLYGTERHRVPWMAWVRSGLISYAVMCVVPMGRAVAEATRAAMLSRYVGGARAAGAAARMQAVALLGNAAISIPCSLAALLLVGPGWLLVLVGGNFVVTLLLGGGVLFVGRRSRVGAWIAKRFQGGQGWGSELDQHLRGEEVVPLGAVSWVFLGRTCQTLQRVVLLFALGVKVGALQGLCAEAIHLVSGSVGDIVPGQLGVTEALYNVSAQVLSLTPSDGVALALIAHLAQLFWLGVGSLVPVVWKAPT